MEEYELVYKWALVPSITFLNLEYSYLVTLIDSLYLVEGGGDLIFPFLVIWGGRKGKVFEVWFGVWGDWFLVMRDFGVGAGTFMDDTITREIALLGFW